MIIQQSLSYTAKTSPLRLALIAVGSIALLIASARIQVPMVPVPITLQTAAVLCLACLLGWRGALAVLCAYFTLGLIGLPVFSMTAGAIPGPAYFVGPTGGYLIGFAMATALIGYVFEQRGRWSLISLFGLMMAGHVIILAIGAAWLAYGIPMMGFSEAIAAGIVPFIAGSVLKSAIATGFVKSLLR